MGQDQPGSPGSGGASPYLRRGFPGFSASWRHPAKTLPFIKPSSGRFSLIGDKSRQRFENEGRKTGNLIVEATREKPGSGRAKLRLSRGFPGFPAS